MRPKPKQLTERPAVFEAGAGGIGGGVLVDGRRGADELGARRVGRQTVVTDEAGEVAGAGAIDGRRAADAGVRAVALEIAERLSIPRPRRLRTSRRGYGELLSVPYRSGLDDIDIDRTVEVLAATPAPEPEEIIVRERVRARRSVVLAVDVSGSMRGERIRTAAATIGALAGQLAHDNLALLAFWSDAAWLAHLGPCKRVLTLVDQLLGLPTRGLTNVAFPLELATRELAGVAELDARVVLLSDCVHNAGPDPRPLAARLPRLDVLIDVTGEHDLALGRDLARFGRGRAYAVADHRNVAPALTDAFAP